MKQIILLLICCAHGLHGLTQNVIEIDLDQWKGKDEKIPFNINTVRDMRAHPEHIGFINIGKNKRREINFQHNSETMIQQFIDKNFAKGSDMDIKLTIEHLTIQEVILEKKKNKKVTNFLFSCKFYRANGDLKEPLYTFNARNSIPKKSALKLAMTNFIGRAITSAILNFRKSYKKHPEWKTDEPSGPQVQIHKQVLFNQFAGGDTIGLNGQYTLQPSDFSASVNEEESDKAYSYFMITYDLVSNDQAKDIYLNIMPKAYFLRSKSWAKNSNDQTWLKHQQLLFDLASYHALSFKKQLEEKKFSAGFYKAEINKIYNKVSAAYFDEMDELQAETRYGEHLQKEALWRAKVDAYLKK